MRVDAIEQAVAAETRWMERLLTNLVDAPTVLGNEEAGQVIMAAAFADCDLAPVDVALDPVALRADPGHSPFSWDISGKRNVVASWEAQAPRPDARSLILNGHIDVVPPASSGLWSSAPFKARQQGDWMYGRGAGDMKAGLVAMTGAVRALRLLGTRLGADLQLQSVVEEECTGNGTLQCLIAGASADAAILTEPHHDHFTVAQVGVLWFHVDVRGQPAHAARATSLGRNALDAALIVIAELRALEAEMNTDPPAPYDSFDHPINLNVGVATAGDWPSTVPAECTLSCRLACYPGEDPAWLCERVEAAIAGACQRDLFLAAHPPQVRYDGFRGEGCTLSNNEPLVTELAAAYTAFHGTAPALRATTATTDARHFIRRGIPAICYGPQAEQIHGIDERAAISSVVAVATVLARFIVGWCKASW